MESFENNYEYLAPEYKKTHEKPDKKYSILPTVLTLCDCIKRPPHIITDLGCGDGFFTEPLALKYPTAQVIGIDNSKAQLDLAYVRPKDTRHIPIEYRNADIFTDTVPVSDIILAPFVLGYATEEMLKLFVRKIYDSLTLDGLAIFVLDNPKGNDGTRFGARKSVAGKALTIELFDESGNALTTLHAHHHEAKSFLQLLQSIRFSNIIIYDPIISEEGMRKFGSEFWNNYREEVELLYVSAKR